MKTHAKTLTLRYRIVLFATALLAGMAIASNKAHAAGGETAGGPQIVHGDMR